MFAKISEPIPKKKCDEMKTKLKDQKTLEFSIAKQLLNCPNCNKIIDSIGELNTHLDQCLDNLIPLCCPSCSFKTENLFLLNDHLDQCLQDIHVHSTTRECIDLT